MKILTCVAFFSLICSVLPYSYSYAADDVSSGDAVAEDAKVDIADEAEPELEIIPLVEIVPDDDIASDVLTVDEAKELINSLPTAGDAIKGVVKQNADKKYYDIYGRQLSYREGAKELRASLEARRESFEVPRVKTLERHRDVYEKVYAAETAAYQDEQGKKDQVSDEELLAAYRAKLEAEPEVVDDVEEVVPVDEGENVADIELSEMPIPPKDGDIDAPKKKVVTSGDAPEFDPSNL